MAEINKIKVSNLPEEFDGKGFWLFGSKKVGSEHISRRFSFDELKKVVEKAAESIQLERRIAVVFESSEQLIPISEAMTIYSFKSRNINKLEYCENKKDSEWKELKENGRVDLDGSCDILLRIVNEEKYVSPKEYAKYSTLTIFAKAKVKNNLI